MAPPEVPPRVRPGRRPQPPKLKRLPSHARIEKRPLLHPAIPSPYTNAQQPKVIYVGCKTPFISVVQRVRKLLALIDKRSVGKIGLVDSKDSEKQRLARLRKQEKEPEEVFLKATNKAIEKVLGLALFFQGQEDCRVRLKTGSVGVVDDIVETEEPKVKGKAVGNLQKLVEAVKTGEQAPEAGGDVDVEEEEDEELPETQIRKVSVVEVGISLR